MDRLSRSRVVLAGIAVIAAMTGVAVRLLSDAGVAGPLLLVMALIAALAAAVPNAWQPVGDLVKRARVEADRLAAITVHGRPVPMTEVDPFDIGVLHSELAERTSAEGQSPHPYVERRMDQRLRDAFEEVNLEATRRLVVVRGDPKAGKSRTLWESVSKLPGRRLVALRDPFFGEGDEPAQKPLTTLLALDRPLSKTGADIVIWIDDVHRHLHRGFTSANMRRLAERYPKAIIAMTIHSAYLEQIKDDFDRPLEDLLRRASRGLILEPVLDHIELAEARRLYPGIADHEDLPRLGELLAGVDLLIARYLEHRSDQPVGVAVATAAINWQRSGMPPGTLTEPVLRELTALALHQVAPQVEMTPKAFNVGLSWARKEVAAQIALVRCVSKTSEDTIRYAALDAIVAWADSNQAPLTHEVWDFVFDRADPADVLTVAVTADRLGETEIARRGWQRAIDSGDPAAAPWGAVNMGVLLKQLGDPVGARDAFQFAINSGYQDATPFGAVNLGLLLRRLGDPEGARTAFQRAIDSNHPEVRPRACMHLGRLLEQLGDLDAAQSAYQQAIDTDHPDVAPEARKLLAALSNSSTLR